MNRFSDNFRSLLKQRGLNQAEFAVALGYSSSTISNWVTGRNQPSIEDLSAISQFLGISSDVLLGLQPNVAGEFEHEGIKWRQFAPPLMHETLKSDIETGIALFRAMYIEGAEIETLLHDTRFRDYDLLSLPLTFVLAVRSGAFKLIEVPRDFNAEKKLVRQYSLRQAIVANVPFNRDETAIRAEFAAFLAATLVLPSIRSKDVIGLGPGYTISRFAELSTPSRDIFRGTKWIPLVASGANNLGSHSANFIALLMASRHIGSESLFLPFFHKDKILSEDERRDADRVSRTLLNANALFATVNGDSRRLGRNREALPIDQFRAADYYSLGNMSGLYAKIIEDGRASELAGEFLGLLLDSRAQPIQQIAVENRKAFSQIEFAIVRQVVSNASVWIVAAGAYKAEPTYVMLKNNLANALVVDSDIANYLLKHA